MAIHKIFTGEDVSNPSFLLPDRWKEKELIIPSRDELIQSVRLMKQNVNAVYGPKER